MPHREWNPKSFFRSITPNVLFRLLRQPFLRLSLDGSGPLFEQVYRSWKDLPDLTRQRSETMLLPINDLCAPHARPYLDELARAVWAGLAAGVEAHHWPVQDLAVRLFLADPKRFFEVHKRYALDLSEPRAEFRGRYELSPQASPAKKAELEHELSKTFLPHQPDVTCHVEDFSDESRLVLCVFYEGEFEPRVFFRDDEGLECDWHRRVHRIGLTFYRSSSTLSIGPCTAGEALALSRAFGRVFAQDASYFEDSMRCPRFSFERLRDPTFTFPTRPADQIESVSVVRVSMQGLKPELARMDFDLEPLLSLEVVHRVLGEHGLSLVSDVIEGVRLQVRFQGTGRSRIRTVQLTNPNLSNLADTARDNLIRSYLKEWGIDGTRQPALEPPGLKDEGRKSRVRHTEPDLPSGR